MTGLLDVRERMGSGGPRGLQILRSGVSVRGGFDSHAFPPLLLKVGLLVSALAGMPLAARTGTAQAATADTTASAPVAAPDTAAGVTTIPSSRDSAGFGTRAPRTPRTLYRPGRFDQPRWVMLRSLLVPGWGQAHNHAWIKAALLAAGDGALRVRMVRDERRLGRLNRDADARLGDLTAAAADTAAAGAEYRAALASGDQQRIEAAQAALLAANLRVAGASDAYKGVVNVYNALLQSSINRRWLVGGVIAYALLDAYVDAHLRSFDIDFQLDPALPGGSQSPGGRLRLRWAF